MSFKTQQKWFISGFSLVELMIVVAIIGILSAIAVPAYRNYIYKARISELISYAGNLKDVVSDYLAETGVSGVSVAVPANSCPNTMPGGVAGTPGTTITNTWAISTACIVTVVSQAVIAGATATVTLTPVFQADGSLKWTCTTGNAYAPATCP